MEREISHSKPSVHQAHINAVVDVLNSNLLAEGAKCEELSEVISKRFGGRKVILTNSGSSALYFSLQLLHINEGDEIILPSYVCVDVIQAVYAAGGTPVLCDIGELWNAGVSEIEKKITAKTRAIIVTHNLGILADVQGLKKFNVPIIEDCCQCLGETISGKMAGMEGDMAILSFQPTKAMTTGEGGAIVLNSDRTLGDAQVDRLAHILRISDMQGALGLSQWKDYPGFLLRRRKLADLYFDLLPKELTATFKKVYHTTTFFRFLLLGIPDFESFRAFMLGGKVHVRKGIDDLLHRSTLNISDQEYPNAVKMFEGTVSLPLYPTLNEEDIRYISELVIKYWNGRN